NILRAVLNTASNYLQAQSNAKSFARDCSGSFVLHRLFSGFGGAGGLSQRNSRKLVGQPSATLGQGLRMGDHLPDILDSSGKIHQRVAYPERNFSANADGG